MTAYRFQARFVAPIKAGTKQQTIRAPRRGKSPHAPVGGALQLFTGSRFKPVRLGAATCQESGFVLLSFDTDRLSYNHVPRGMQLVTRARALDRFAIRDGFDDWAEMARFWQEVHEVRTFAGVLTFWGDTFRASPTPAGADDATNPNEVDDEGA